MRNIEKILQENTGNRLTNELIIGLFAMISHHVKRVIDESKEAASDQQVEAVQVEDALAKPLDGGKAKKAR